MRKYLLLFLATLAVDINLALAQEPIVPQALPFSSTASIEADTNSPTVSNILGGEFVDFSNSPVTLILGREHSCTGSLVAANLVLTAAHCLKGFVEDYLVVINKRTFSLSGAYYHPLYQHAGGTHFANSQYDLGILVLSVPAVGQELLPVVIDYPSRVGEPLWIAGYGANEFSAQNHDDLLKNGKSAPLVVEYIGQGMLSSSRLLSSSSSCAGDSGGPLLRVYDNLKIAAAIGVISTGSNGIDARGNCLLGQFGSSNFVNLQSISSQEFLSYFPDIYRLSGRLAHFYNELRGLENKLQILAQLRSQRWVTSGIKKLSKELTALESFADQRGRRMLKRISALMKRAASGKTVKKSIKSLRTASVLAGRAELTVN